MKVLVVGCDAYAHLAPRFMTYWRRAWSECPYDVEFVADKKELDVKVPVVYTKRRSLDYGGKLHDYLEQCEDELILIMMIDFVTAYVDEPLVSQAEELAKGPRVGRIQLSRPGNVRYSGARYDRSDMFRVIPCRRRYALSTHVGVWKRDLLLKFVHEGESPGDTEVQGTGRMHRANCDDKVLLSTKRPAIYVVNTHRFGEVKIGEKSINTVISDTKSLAENHRT